MQRIHIHWTGGRHEPNQIDREHYHFLYPTSGGVVKGAHAPEANIPPLRRGHYAAHTLNANSGAIGVALCGMWGASREPFDPGHQPLIEEQVETMIYHVAELADEYDIPVSPERILTHAEVQANLGIRQNGKWDLRWLPGPRPQFELRPALEIGEELRARIRAAQKPRSQTHPIRPAPRGLLRTWFGGGER